MNEKVLRTLEYYKIIDILTEQATSPLGKKKCRELLPISNLRKIRENQTETGDALSRILKKGMLSFSGVRDLRPSIMRLEIGASLNISELLQLSSLLTATLRVKNYGNQSMHVEFSSSEEENSTDKMERTDSLSERFIALEPLSPLRNEIQRCIVSEEDVSDDASPGLHHVRRSIKLTNARVHEQLNAMVNTSSMQTMLQDNLVTMRNGRYCLPVRAEYKNQVQGMVHDQSASGSTLFIEPMAVVKLNNELRELALKEQEEIEKILADLSNQAAEYTEEIKTNIAILEEFDFIFAKASLAKMMRASEPVLNENGYINIKMGRHPLIDAKKVVPIDIRLGNTYKLLIVTGPNTGGKTVSLKTVGLFTLMAQAGLHIPAFEGSELSVFEEVYADIGDEQSIEQSLSTFSSHMTNTVSILEKADSRSLTLFDELGAGTDPTEGAALAISILHNLLDRNVTAMATTHYSELKLFALSTNGVENACCEFDVSTLRPTYRLLIGIPGKSNAFAISQKLGLPMHIIEDAKKRIGNDEKTFEEVISDLEQSRITIEKEQAEITKYKEEIADLKQKLHTKNEKIDNAKDRILRNANEEARKIVQEAKDFADETIRNYNKWGKDTNKTKAMEQERAALRNKLNKLDSKLTDKNKKKSKKKHKASDFHLGDSVQVLSLGLKGTVSSLPNEKGDLFVQMGILRSQVNISDLELVDEPVITGPNLKRTNTGQIKMSKSASIRPDINLIGLTVDEAISRLDKYLDDAYLSHLPQVTVIHGRGTGALKNAVHAHLKRTSYVKSYRIGEFGEGDHGVTIVEFK